MNGRTNVVVRRYSLNSLTIFLIAAALAPPFGAAAQTDAFVVQTAQAAAMSGAWTVDLSVDPASPYLKPMNLVLQADGAVIGDFYESEIEAGRWKTQGGRTCVSFRSSDGAGPYHSAACLVGGSIAGQTWAEHRDFVFVWSAVRAAAD